MRLLLSGRGVLLDVLAGETEAGVSSNRERAPDGEDAGEGAGQVSRPRKSGAVAFRVVEPSRPLGPQITTTRWRNRTP